MTLTFDPWRQEDQELKVIPRTSEVCDLSKSQATATRKNMEVAYTDLTFKCCCPEVMNISRELGYMTEAVNKFLFLSTLAKFIFQKVPTVNVKAYY